MIIKTCNKCNKKYKVNKHRQSTTKYCSKQCMIADKKANLIEIECPTCTKTFQREQWKQKNSHKGKYCSTECYQNRSPQVNIECICGNKFKAYQSRASYYGRLYCSQKCYLKNGFLGRLTNDIPEVTEYSRFVVKLRSTARYLQWNKACRERDNNKCIICNKTEQLTVHHIDSIFSFVKKYGIDQQKIEKDELFFDLNNGTTLCRSCHLERHRRKNE